MEIQLNCNVKRKHGTLPYLVPSSTPKSSNTVVDSDVSSRFKG